MVGVVGIIIYMICFNTVLDYTNAQYRDHTMDRIAEPTKFPTHAVTCK